MQISHRSDVPLQGQILSKLNVSGFDYVISTEVININRNGLVTHTDTDSADATMARPYLSVLSVMVRIASAESVTVRIVSAGSAGSASKFWKVSKFRRGRVNRNDP